MFTLAAALALAAQEPELPLEGSPVTDLCVLPGEDAAAVRSSWAIIDARAIYNPSDLADALLAVPAGKRAVVRGGNFANDDMRKVAPLLANACLAETELAGSNWEGTEIPHLRLVHIEFIGAKAARARWPGLSTQGVNLQGSDFTGADLTGMRFVSGWQGADFGDVSFRAANLTDASFACSIVYPETCINGAPDFAGADLTRADISGLWLWDAKGVSGAVLNGTIIAPAAFAYLGEARITGPVRMADSYTSPYEDVPGEFPPFVPGIVTITADEARTLIDATRSATQDRPSFDCAKAAAAIEKTLCGEYESELRRLDRELAEAWAAARAGGKGDLAAQRRWLASRGQCDGDRTCLAELYEARIAVLRGLLGPGIALRPGESVTYVDDTLPLPDTMRRGELYERIVPVLSEASGQDITLTGNPDGSIAAEGSAVRANAHTCEMGAPVTRFDPATGWWSARSESGRKVPLFRVEGRRIVLRYSGNTGNTPEEARGLIDCGMRAFFDDGIDLTAR
ncbi:MAG: pentapeptide repeat-containing protein [Erythrobacter sp.]|uniref:pentapeptide repeat-containing protein n=1 Tax=Erythrobacter sp. TaxID=1042 RepID=UPI0025F1CE75|nr:pentapeptide repeat-containing protein [Erythrobacter sp.]MCL9998409.1 pentapeptide repeat-containing protein [Erythrobacter sp.]